MSVKRNDLFSMSIFCIEADLYLSDIMLKIRQLQKKKQDEDASLQSNAKDDKIAVSNNSTSAARVSAAQLRLQKDLTELDLPKSIKVNFTNPSNIFNFVLSIVPQEGFYKMGLFKFTVEINENFPIDPPKIRCMQKIYHPNIDLDGNICLNILREDWSPVLNLNSVIIGLNFLFLEPNPNDPLNKEAANVLAKNKNIFASNVKVAMRGGSVDGERYDRVI